MEFARKLITSAVLAVFLGTALPGPAIADEAGTEEGDDAAVVLDLIILRPLGLVATVAGTAIFVVALPFSLPSRSVGKTFNVLIKDPAKYTFTRKLGEERNP